VLGDGCVGGADGGGLEGDAGGACEDERVEVAGARGAVVRARGVEYARAHEGGECVGAETGDLRALLRHLLDEGGAGPRARLAHGHWRERERELDGCV
jgi:hypothetical protein